MIKDVHIIYDSYLWSKLAALYKHFELLSTKSVKYKIIIVPSQLKAFSVLFNGLAVIWKQAITQSQCICLLFENSRYYCPVLTKRQEYKKTHQERPRDKKYLLIQSKMLACWGPRVPRMQILVYGKDKPQL